MAGKVRVDGLREKDGIGKRFVLPITYLNIKVLYPLFNPDEKDFGVQMQNEFMRLECQVLKILILTTCIIRANFFLRVI